MIFDTKKVLCVREIFDILFDRKPNLARTDSSSNTEFNSIEVQIKPPVFSNPAFSLKKLGGMFSGQNCPYKDTFYDFDQNRRNCPCRDKNCSNGLSGTA